MLGGGALKVEALDLRRLVFPALDEVAIADLNRLGKILDGCDNLEVLAEIDWLVGIAVAGPHASDAPTARLVSAASTRLADRSRPGRKPSTPCARRTRRSCSSSSRWSVLHFQNPANTDGVLGRAPIIRRVSNCGIPLRSHTSPTTVPGLLLTHLLLRLQLLAVHSKDRHYVLRLWLHLTRARQE